MYKDQLATGLVQQFQNYASTLRPSNNSEKIAPPDHNMNIKQTALQTQLPVFEPGQRAETTRQKLLECVPRALLRICTVSRATTSAGLGIGLAFEPRRTTVDRDQCLLSRH